MRHFARDKKERARVIEELKNETRTIIIYEAPHHLIKTVTELYNALGDRELTVCRELTKKARGKGADYIFGAFGAFKDTGAKRRICACNLWQKRG